MEILFINHSFNIFNNLNSGASHRSTMLVYALSQIGHVDVVSFIDNEVSNIDNCSVIYSQSCNHRRKDGRLHKLKKILPPYTVESIYGRDKVKENIIDGFISQKQYDFIAIRYFNQAAQCGCLKYSSRLILDIDDDPKSGCLVAVKNAHTFRNKIYNYYLSIIVGWMVRKTLNNVRYIFHSNINQPPHKNSVLLHNVIVNRDIIPDVSDKTPARILIVGNFYYGVNEMGVSYFLDHIYPKLKDLNPQLSLHIVGNLPNNGLAQKWEAAPDVTVTGYVADIAQEYKDARLVAVPIYLGTGTCVKVVEALNMNRLCVSTPQGIRGYSVLENGTDYLLARNDREFIEKINYAINDVDVCNAIAHAGKKQCDRHYSNEEFLRIVIDTIYKIG